MGVKRLREVSGEIQTSGAPPEGNDRIVRRAVLVHAGEDGQAVTLHSSDGPITFDDARIQAVVDAQNQLIDNLIEHYGNIDNVPSGAYPPILDQHEADSTNRVIGRLTGRLSFERRAVPKVGKNVACACADITFLGVETVDRVRDGRIFHLSIGIDEESNTLTETSAVIDPAAPGAMILKKGTKNLMKTKSKAKGQNLLVEVTFRADERYSEGLAHDTADIIAKKAGYQDLADGPWADPTPDGGMLFRAEYKKRLRALSQGAKMPQKKMAAERLKKLKAAQSSLKTLSAKLVQSNKTIALAAAKANVVKRLSAVVKGGKMTPAEFKKLDVTKLAALDKGSLDIVVSAYEAREPQVAVGQRGSASAMNFMDVGNALEKKQQKRLRAEIAGDFKRMGAKVKHLSEDDEQERAKRLADEDDKMEKRLEGDADAAPEAGDIPTVDDAAASPEMQKQIDELNTQVSRIAGIVSDLVDDAQADESADDADDVADDTADMADADEKDSSELEAEPKNDDDKKELSGEDAEEDKK